MCIFAGDNCFLLKLNCGTMKQSIFVAGMILLAAGCSNERVELAENAVVERAVAPVTVRVSGFSISQEGFAWTRGTAVGTYDGVNVLTLAFYQADDGSQVFKQTQIKGSMAAGETFGEFSTRLGVGSYTMVVIANGGSNAVALTSPTEATYGENRVLDTFVNTQTVTVSSSAAVSVSATLERVVTALVVQSTDTRRSISRRKDRSMTSSGSRRISSGSEKNLSCGDFPFREECGDWLYRCTKANREPRSSSRE